MRSMWRVIKRLASLLAAASRYSHHQTEGDADEDGVAGGTHGQFALYEPLLMTLMKLLKMEECCDDWLLMMEVVECCWDGWMEKVR